MMTMFGTLVQRLTSPVTSPTSSRRRFKSPSRWEVQSDPEDDSAAPVRKSRAKHLLDKRKSKSRVRALHSSQSDHLQMCNIGGWHDVTFPPLRGTKSLGRLDGMKEVSALRRPRGIASPKGNSALRKGDSRFVDRPSQRSRPLSSHRLECTCTFVAFHSVPKYVESPFDLCLVPRVELDSYSVSLFLSLFLLASSNERRVGGLEFSATRDRNPITP